MIDITFLYTHRELTKLLSNKYADTEGIYLYSLSHEIGYTDDKELGLMMGDIYDVNRSLLPKQIHFNVVILSCF